MKVLLLGAGGLLGRHLSVELARRGIAFRACRHEEMDITEPGVAARMLALEQPGWVVNTAALCSFDACEEAPEISEEVNFIAPMRWAEECHARGIRYCHFTSDYIFDGRSRVPYTEESPARPLGVYAQHKAALERELAQWPEHLVLRVAWLFGEGSPTFMSQMPLLLMSRDELTVASGKTGTCLHAGYGAELVVRMLRGDAGGLFNMVHAGETSWEAFAAETLRQLRERGLEPRCGLIHEVPFTEMFARHAGRPAYSPLDTGKLTRWLGHPPLDWRAGLGRYLDTLALASR